MEAVLICQSDDGSYIRKAVCCAIAIWSSAVLLICRMQPLACGGRDAARPHGTAGGEDEKMSSSAPDVPRSSKIGPAASLLLQGAGLTKEDVSPSGPGGIVTKGDVMRAIAGAANVEPSDNNVLTLLR